MFRTSKILKKYILSYLCILMIPLLVMSGFVYNYVLDVLNEEVQTNNLHTLQRAREIIEAQMEYILSLENTVYLESSLNPFLLEEDTLKAMEIQKELSGYLRINPFLYDMAYYQEDDDYIITAHSSCPKEQFFNSMYQYEDWNYARFVKGLREGNGTFIKDAQEVETASGERKELTTVIQPLGKEPYSRCVIYLVDSAFLANSLPYSDEYAAAAVFTPEGKVVACSGEVDLIRSIPVDFFREERKPDDVKIRDEVKIGNDCYLVSYVRSGENGWLYLSLVPGASIIGKVEHVKFLITAMFFLVLTGGGIGAYFLARSNYAPIRDLEKFTNTILEDKKAAGEIRESASEIDHIANALKYLDQQNKSLAVDNELKVSALQDRFIDRLLSGWYTDEKQILQSAEKAGISFHKSRYRVAVLYLYRFPVETGPQIEEALRSCVPRGIDIFVKIRSDVGNVIIITGYDQDGEDRLERYLADMAELLQSNMKMRSIMAVGGQAAGLTEVARSCQEALSALEYRIVLYQQKIIHYEEIAQRGKESFQICPRDLTGFIRNRNINGMEEFLDGALEELCGRDTNIKRILRQCSDFILTIQSTIEEVNRDYFAEDPLYDDISGIIKYENCYELIEIIRLIGYDIIDHLNSLSGNSTIEDMLLYIRENGFSCEFSTAVMAENFKMSLPYLSLYFKNHMGSNLLDYVTDMKINRAKELLTGTALPVKEIAVQVGYFNVNSFQRRFKQIVGCTPGEYRRKE